MLNLRRRLPGLVAVVLLAGRTLPALCAQDPVQVEFVPSSELLGACPGTPLEVDVRLSNPAGLEVGGYQIFLRFPARYFEAIRYEAPGTEGGFLAVEGPAPFGGGYEDCDESTGDRWADRAGDDVVSVVATLFGDSSSGPAADTEMDLGRFVFRTLGSLPGLGAVEFSSNVEACRRGFDATTRVFGPAGQALPMSPPDPASVTFTEAGPTLGGLVCVDLGATVRLQWSRPDGGAYTGFRIYRNGESLAQLPLPGIFEYEDRDPPGGTLEYEVAVILLGGGEGCRARCTVERDSGMPFLRGDANRDRSLNISDAIALLGHLFRGVPITCLDAGDFDDSGNLNITDVIAILNYLFEPGEKPTPPAPFPAPGPDPTDDMLGCEA